MEDITTEQESEGFVLQDSFNKFVQVMFQDILKSDSDMKKKLALLHNCQGSNVSTYHYCLRSKVSYEEYKDSCFFSSSDIGRHE